MIDSTEHNDIAKSQIVEDVIKANTSDKVQQRTKKKKSFIIIITILIIVIALLTIILSPKREQPDIESTSVQSTAEGSSTLITDVKND